MKLNSSDARAVDALLDSAAAGTAMDDEIAKRLACADNVLRLLDFLPAEEPSATLVERTMRRVEQAPPADAFGEEAALTAPAPRMGIGQRPS